MAVAGVVDWAGCVAEGLVVVVGSATEVAAVGSALSHQAAGEKME